MHFGGLLGRVLSEVLFGEGCRVGCHLRCLRCCLI